MWWGKFPTSGLWMLASFLVTQYVTTPPLETMGLRKDVLFVDLVACRTSLFLPLL